MIQLTFKLVSYENCQETHKSAHDLTDYKGKLFTKKPKRKENHNLDFGFNCSSLNFSLRTLLMTLLEAVRGRLSETNTKLTWKIQENVGQKLLYLQ